MRTALAATWTLLLGMALLMLGAGLQGTLVGLRASLEGFPTLLAGVMLAAYYLGYMAGSVMTPGLVNSVGHVRVFAALTSMASALILVQGVFVDPWSWTLVRILIGYCFAGIYVVAESWLNGRVDNEHRGLLLSIYMLVCYGGLGLGQLLLNVADPRSTLLFILVSVLISVAMVPMALTSSSAPAIAVPVRVGPRQLFRKSPLGVVGVAVAGAVSACLFSLGATVRGRGGLHRHSKSRCSWPSRFSRAACRSCRLGAFPTAWTGARWSSVSASWRPRAPWPPGGSPTFLASCSSRCLRSTAAPA